MRLAFGLSVLLLGVVAAVVADEALDLALVEAGAQMPSEEFTICLRDKPMMCLGAGADLKADGSPLVLGDRLRTAGQTFRLENGVLKFSGSGDRVVAAEHGAQNKLDTQEGGRVWIWKQQELAFEQQWLANEDLASGSAQLCMRAFPKACLYTSFPAENKVIIANADHTRTLWVLRPVKPCAVNPCDANAQCAEQPDGQAKCTCNAGYKLGADNKCFEVDLCASPSTNPCDEHASCAKTGPAKTACTCHNGYTGKGEKGQCAPINACTADPTHPPCDANAACTSTGPNTFKCQCKPGFVATGPTSCAELDLCAVANPCASTATCTKTGPGKVSCQCNPGFAGNGQSCAPVDGCEGTPCGEHATCVRQPLGGRQCNCDAGYAVDKKSKTFRCAEADPCALTGAAAVCKGRNTYCKKTGPGSHKCLCKAGFLAFFNGNCEKPGSKEALEAASQEGSESARQELIIQQRKAKEAEAQRKEMEREFRRKQKEREENIRALERRIRDLIREKTNARIHKRDAHIAQLSERVAQIQQQQAEASKTAAIQLQLIKALEQNEAGKAKRLEAVVERATKAVQDQAVAYAAKLREATRDRMAARMEQFDAEQKLKDIAATAAARGPPLTVEQKTGKAPAAPPQYGNNFSTPPLKLPIGKPTIAQKQAQEKAAQDYANASAAPKPAPAPAPHTGPAVAATSAAAAPNPKPEQPLRNPAEVASRFAQVNAETEADAAAESEAEADAAVAHRVAAEAEADAAQHVTAEVEVDQSAELLAEAERAAAATPEGQMESDIAAAMADMSGADVEQSDEDLAEQLTALHADVDAHLSQVMLEDGAEADVALLDAEAQADADADADADAQEDEADADEEEEADA